MRMKAIDKNGKEVILGNIVEHVDGFPNGEVVGIMKRRDQGLNRDYLMLEIRLEHTIRTIHTALPERVEIVGWNDPGGQYSWRK